MTPAANHHPQTVLIVDDSRVTTHMLEGAVSVLGYRSVVFTSPSEGLAWLRDNSPELALFDVNMPGIDGLMMLESMRNLGAAFPMVLITAHPSETLAQQAARLGATDVIAKPVSVDTLQQLIEHAAEQRRKIRPAAAAEPAAPPEPVVADTGDPTLSSTDRATCSMEQAPPTTSDQEYLARVEVALPVTRRWLDRCVGYQKASVSGDWSAAELQEMLEACASAELELRAVLERIWGVE